MFAADFIARPSALIKFADAICLVCSTSEAYCILKASISVLKYVSASASNGLPLIVIPDFAVADILNPDLDITGVVK